MFWHDERQILKFDEATLLIKYANKSENGKVIGKDKGLQEELVKKSLSKCKNHVSLTY